MPSSANDNSADAVCCVMLLHKALHSQQWTPSNAAALHSSSLEEAGAESSFFPSHRIPRAVRMMCWMRYAGRQAGLPAASAAAGCAGLPTGPTGWTRALWASP